MKALVLPRVIIRGGGDLATGVAWRLYVCGFPLLVLELAHPLVIRHSVAFASAVFRQSCTVEGVRAVRVDAPLHIAREDFVPVVVDASGEAVRTLRPDVVVDARMTKTSNDSSLRDAPLVVGLGPGFEAARDCHVVVETHRGHFLGRVCERALGDTGVPGTLGGHSVHRVLRAPCDGRFRAHAKLGDRVEAGETVGEVDGTPVVTAINGSVRGLLWPDTPVWRGLKVGDVDPRPAAVVDLDVISDKSRAVAGGVLEAILTWMHNSA